MLRKVEAKLRELNEAPAKQQRNPLTDEQAYAIQKDSAVRTALLNYSAVSNDRAAIALVKAIAAHGIKENT